MPKSSKIQPANIEYQLLTDAAGDAIFTADLKGRITYANIAAQKLLNASALQIMGKEFKKFTHPDSLAAAWDCFNKARRGDAQVTAELDALTIKGQVIPVEVNISPLYKDGKVISVHGVVRDIRKRRLLDKLGRESERMKLIHFFVAGTAKEIKNPLLAILNRTEGILNQYKSRDFEYIGYKEFTDIIHSLEDMHIQLKRCFETIDRLILMNQKRTGHKETSCSVNGVVQDILKLMDQQFKLSGIKLKLHLAKALPLVPVPEIDLQQAVSNIIVNAIQAMPTGGNLFLRTSVLGKKVVLEIRDNGIGIPKENIPFIFDPFFTTKHREGERNSGLGLAIVYSILRAYHADIEVKSSLRVGTSVKLIFPALRSGKSK